MDIISKALGINSLDNETFKNICDLNGYEHSDSVYCFVGWKRGEFSEEHKKNMSIAASKRIRTKEHIKKLHEGRRNSKNSVEHSAVIIASRLCSLHSEETKKKMSEKKLANPNTKINASKAGKISAMKRPSNYSELQSIKAKAAWARRKEGLVNGD
jgi:hypothetical protein